VALVTSGSLVRAWRPAGTGHEASQRGREAAGRRSVAGLRAAGLRCGIEVSGPENP
jgi:hypothetical protein